MGLIQHLHTRSYESLIMMTAIDTLAIGELHKGGVDTKIKHTLSTTSTLLSHIDPEASVLVVTGHAIDQVKDTKIIEYFNTVLNVPFVEVFVVGSMSNIFNLPSAKVFKGTETETPVQQFYDHVCGENAVMLQDLGTRPLQHLLPLYNSYMTYTFNDNYKEAMALKSLADVFELSTPKILRANSYSAYPRNDTLKCLVEAQLLSMLEYVERRVKWTAWQVVPYNGDYVTIGITSAEKYKNEIAHQQISMSNTDKVISIVLEDKGYQQVTIRTSGIDALEIAKLMDSNAKGKPQASTVFLSLNQNTTKDILMNALVSTLTNQ